MRRNTWVKRLFPYIIIFIILPWPVAFAAGTEVTGGNAVSIEIAEPSAQPSYTVSGKAIGGISKPGDLFYVDATNSPSEVELTLSLINSQRLISYYRYLILDVGVYVQNTSGEWERATTNSGEPLPKTILSMRNGQVGFLLPGSSRYRVAIDGGCFFCIKVAADGFSHSPQFHLEAN
jgi:hypothetical protein